MGIRSASGGTGMSSGIQLVPGRRAPAEAAAVVAMPHLPPGLGELGSPFSSS